MRTRYVDVVIVRGHGDATEPPSSGFVIEIRLAEIDADRGSQAVGLDEAERQANQQKHVAPRTEIVGRQFGPTYDRSGSTHAEWAKVAYMALVRWTLRTRA